MTANESSSTPLELDIDDINAAIKGRRSSPRNKSIYSSIARRESPTPSNKRTELSPSISRKPSTASFDGKNSFQSLKVSSVALTLCPLFIP